MSPLGTFEPIRDIRAHSGHSSPFGTFVRAKREEAGITLTDFARQLDISPAFWWRIETGRDDFNSSCHSRLESTVQSRPLVLQVKTKTPANNHSQN